MRVTTSVALAALVMTSTAGHAFDLDFEDYGKLTFKSRYSVGAGWRLQQRSDALIGKLNVPGQKDLCAADNCYSLSGDPAPNARLVNAAGGFFAHNADNGDINYDRYDVYAVTNKLSTDVTYEHGDFLARVRAVGFFDPINYEFNERHFNDNYQDFKGSRPGNVAGHYAKGVHLYDAFVQYNTSIADHTTVFSVGNQTVRWGESNLVALNSVNEINALNANFLHMPGGEINEVFMPVPVFLVSTDVADGVTADLLYQFGWKRTEPDAVGSFFSSSDIAGSGRYAGISLGQFPEDPDRKAKLAGPLGLLSSTSTTLYPQERNPSSQGQYGIKLGYNAEWLGSGTELGFYFLNYHSRLPYASVISSNDSCARNSTDITSAISSCNGFTGTLFPDAAHQVLGAGKEPLPIESLQVLLEYPENIQMYGISFNTTVGKISLSGEFSFRPNLPTQVHLPDVVFAGLQPALPAQPINVLDPTGGAFASQATAVLKGLGLDPASLPGTVGALSALGAGTIPSAQQAIPSFLVAYRGLGRVQPNTYIPGYERLSVGQLDLTAIRIWSTNPFGADQVILLAEAGFTQFYNMPSKSVLQFEGSNANDSHASGGGDGTGLTAANSCTGAITGQARDYTCHLNPHQQTSGFADDFAWGIRTLVRMEYNNAIFGRTLKPTFGLTWDVDGTAPSPTQNFVQGRKEFLAGGELAITSDFAARVVYTNYFGGKRSENLLADRDNIQLSLSYSF